MRLIDADEVTEIFREVIGKVAKEPTITKDLEHLVRASAVAIQIIGDAPTVKSDRPKGKWEWSETERIGLSYGGTGYVPMVKCSHCDRITELYLLDEKPTEFVIDYPNFCPHCGADMREKHDEV